MRVWIATVYLEAFRLSGLLESYSAARKRVLEFGKVWIQQPTALQVFFFLGGGVEADSIKIA